MVTQSKTKHSTNSRIFRLLTTILVFISLLQLPNSCRGNEFQNRAKLSQDSQEESVSVPEPAESAPANYDGRSSVSSARILDPLGVWKSARNVVLLGVHRFRESLQEGVKVAQMLREDVDEGVGLLIPNRKSRNNEAPLSQSSSGDKTSGDKASADERRPQIQAAEPNLADYGQGQQLPREGVLGGILKFIGVDSSSIGIILLNILIFVAEMVTSTMLGKDANSIADTRMLKANIFEWIITGKNEKVSNILNEAQSHELPQHLIEILRRRTGNKTSCVQLLVCKMSPFIWSIQQTVDKELKSYQNSSFDDDSRNPNPRKTNDGLSSYLTTKYFESIWSQLFQLIPEKSKFLSFGDTCEKKFPTCKLLKFPSKANVGVDNHKFA